ncbi:MAG: STAS domain-containing protein [Anaerolineae bacterium]
MEIATREMKRVVLVSPSGRIDHQTAPELQTVLNELIESGHFKIVVDMEKVTYISSAGLRVLLAARKGVKRWNRGDLRLAAVQPYVRETLELVGFTRIFEIYDDTVEAVGSF